MSLSRIVYYSETVDEHDLNLNQLLAVSYKNNERDRITGFLLLNEGYFLQALEGSRKAVHGLYSKIERDQRHKNLVLMQLVDIKKRAFPSWSMGFYTSDDATAGRILEQYFASSRIDPFNADPESVVEALKEIATIAAQMAQASLAVSEMASDPTQPGDMAGE